MSLLQIVSGKIAPVEKPQQQETVLPSAHRKEPSSSSETDVEEDEAVLWVRKHIRPSKGIFLLQEDVVSACDIRGRVKFRRIGAAIKKVYRDRIQEGSFNNQKGWVNAIMVNLK